jgi:hypothetical protein
MNDYVNQAIVMVTAVIAAATPIAKKAWEISLLTLQIDALATMVVFLLMIVGSVVMVVLLRRRRAKEMAAYTVACAKVDAENIQREKDQRWLKGYPLPDEFTIFDGPGLF